MQVTTPTNDDSKTTAKTDTCLPPQENACIRWWVTNISSG